MIINNMHVIHILIWFKYFFIESEKLVSGISKLWEETDGCANKYGCALTIYLMNMLSSSYSIIMDRAIDSPAN